MISILFATRCRTYLAIRTLQQMIDTSSSPFEFIVGIEDDVKSLSEISLLLSSAPDRISYRIDYKKNAEGTNRAWNRLLPLSSGELICLAGDDAIYYPNWLEFALESHESRLGGYGMVGLNDKMFNGWQLATTPLYDKKFCREVLGGVCFVPHYDRYCADNEMFERAVASGHYYFEERSVVEHVPTQVPEDNPTKMHRMKYYDRDRRLLDTRRSLGFPSDYPSLI